MNNQIYPKSGFEVNHPLSEDDFQQKDKIDNFKYEAVRSAFDALNKNENTVDFNTLKKNYNSMKQHNQINIVDEIAFESIFVKAEKNESNSFEKKYDYVSVVRTIQEDNRSLELYEYFPEDLKAEFSVCRALIEKNPLMYEKLPPEVQKNEFICRILIQHDPSMFEKLLPEMQKSEYLCRELLWQNPLMFDKLPPEMQKNENLCVKFLQQNPSMFEKLPPEMQKNENVCRTLVGEALLRFKKLPLEMQKNEALCIIHIRRDPSMFDELLPEMQKNENVCIALMERDPSMFHKLPPEMQKNENVCIALMERDPSMFHKLPPEVQKNETMCIDFIKENPSVFDKFSTTMQNIPSVREAFQLYSKGGGLWDPYSIKQDKDSQGYIYTFVLDKRYDFVNCESNERKTIVEQFENKMADLFPAIQIDLLSNNNFMLMNKSTFGAFKEAITSVHGFKPKQQIPTFEEEQQQRELLLKLGFNVNLAKKHLTLSIPDQRTLEYRWNQLRKTDFSYPELKFQKCNEIATDKEYIEKLVITEPVDAIISIDKEFIHDMTIHVISIICRCNDSKTHFLSDMQQFRKVCKEYYDKIQKFETLQKTEKNSLNLAYYNRSLSASDVAKLAYFSLSAYIDTAPSFFSHQGFQKVLSNIKSFIEGKNKRIISDLNSRYRKGEFVSIGSDAFELVWEHINKHINMTETKSSL